MSDTTKAVSMHRVVTKNGVQTQIHFPSHLCDIVGNWERKKDSASKTGEDPSSSSWSKGYLLTSFDSPAVIGIIPAHLQRGRLDIIVHLVRLLGTSA